MELTAIEPRRHRLVQLYLDGEAAVKLDAATAQEARLRVGMELDDEELHELLQKSDAARAKEKALYLLEHRPHAKRELERKLSRTVGEEAAQAAADRMEELGLVDDADYAARLAQELARKGYAFSRTVQELVRRGVDRELAQEAAREASPDPEEAIRRLIQSVSGTRRAAAKRRRPCSVWATGGRKSGRRCASLTGIRRRIWNKFGRRRLREARGCDILDCTGGFLSCRRRQDVRILPDFFVRKVSGFQSACGERANGSLPPGRSSFPAKPYIYIVE